MFIATRQIHGIKIDFEDTNKGATTIDKEIDKGIDEKMPLF